MTLTGSAKSFVITAIAALAVVAPPFLGPAVAQYYYLPGNGVTIYPPPRDIEDVQPPRDIEAIHPPRDAEAVHPPGDAADVPAHQAASGTTTPISVVSMRAGPGTENPVIGTLHHGTTLQILATANHGWIQVQSPAGTGWVYGSYLASGTGVPAPTDVNASPPTPISTDGSNQPSNGNHQPATANTQPISVSNQPTNSHPATGANNRPGPEISSP